MYMKFDKEEGIYKKVYVNVKYMCTYCKRKRMKKFFYSPLGKYLNNGNIKNPVCISCYKMNIKENYIWFKPFRNLLNERNKV